MNTLTHKKLIGVTEELFDSVFAAAKLELKRAKGHISVELSPTGFGRVTEKMKDRLEAAQQAVDFLLASDFYKRKQEQKKEARKERERLRKSSPAGKKHQSSYREKNKEKIRQRSRQRMAEWRRTPEYIEWLERTREDRKAKKAEYRRRDGAPTKEQLHHRAEQKRLEKIKKADEKAKFIREFCGPPKPTRLLLGISEYQKWLYHATGGVKDKNKRAKHVGSVSNSYVAQQLGLPVKQVNQSLIEMKREQILFYRSVKKLTKQVKELSNGQ